MFINRYDADFVKMSVIVYFGDASCGLYFNEAVHLLIRMAGLVHSQYLYVESRSIFSDIFIGNSVALRIVANPVLSTSLSCQR